MADFKFRLTTLLRLRETARDERRRALAESQRAADALRREQIHLENEWERLLMTARQAAAPGAVAVVQLVEADRYQQTLLLRREQIAERLAAATADVETRRAALLEADRDVRTLEKLRDAQQFRHRQEIHRQENKRLDEAAQVRLAFTAATPDHP